MEKSEGGPEQKDKLAMDWRKYNKDVAWVDVDSLTHIKYGVRRADPGHYVVKKFEGLFEKGLYGVTGELICVTVLGLKTWKEVGVTEGNGQEGIAKLTLEDAVEGSPIVVIDGQHRHFALQANSVREKIMSSIRCTS